MAITQPDGTDPPADHAQADQQQAPPTRNPTPLQSQPSGTPHEERAASVVQAAYRSHVERRSQNGLALRKDPDKVLTGCAAPAAARRRDAARHFRLDTIPDAMLQVAAATAANRPAQHD